MLEIIELYVTFIASYWIGLYVGKTYSNMEIFFKVLLSINFGILTAILIHIIFEIIQNNYG